MKPARSIACEIINGGHAGQKLTPPMFQPVAEREKGREEIPQAPMSNARFVHLFSSEDKNNAPPDKIKAQPHAAAPTGLARNAAAMASEPIPINQYGLPVSSSGARSHIQPP